MAENDLTTNRRVLNGLLKIYNWAIDLDFQLQVEGKKDKATELQKGIDKLENLIQKLRGKIFDQWTESVPNLRRKLLKMNSSVSEIIHDIEDNVSKTRRITSFIGKIDKVVELLKPLM